VGGVAKVLAPAVERLEQTLAIAQRAAAQVPPVKMEEVKGVVEKPPILAG
jgi:hypothetical protein